MKCSKCGVNERSGLLAYCTPCRAEYMKAYRAAKVEKMQSAVEPSSPSKPEAKTCHVSPVYWSYYMNPGTPLHASMLEAEKVYQVA